MGHEFKLSTDRHGDADLLQAAIRQEGLQCEVSLSRNSVAVRFIGSEHDAEFDSNERLVEVTELLVSLADSNGFNVLDTSENYLVNEE